MSSAGPERGTRAVAAVLAVAADHGLTVTPVVLRSLSTVLLRLDPHPVMARALISGTGTIRAGALGRAIREARLLLHLHALGAPAVPPSTLIPPGPHVRAGVPVVVSARVPHRPGQLDGAALARTLLQVQAALASFPGTLPTLPHLAETNAGLLRPELHGILSARDRARMADAVSAAMTRLVAAEVPLVPVHGDAHSGNALLDPLGTIRWSDLEDASLGPAEWDLACLTATARIFGGDAVMATDAVTAWGGHDEETLARLVEARGVQVAVWGLLAASIEPRRTGAAHRRAEQVLAYLGARR